jgi:tripartite-type tricarboxylate transporter receptor subunit TctC
MNTLHRHLAALAASLTLAAGAASAQQFPNKAVRIIVPSSPGVSTDLVPRAVSPTLAKLLGQPVVIENKPGAGMSLAFEFVAKQSAPDGYTIALVSVSDLSLYPLLVKDTRFDAMKDLPPFIDICDGPLILNSSNALPWKNFQEMVAWARANPGKLNYGASTPTTRLPMVMLFNELGINAVYIPYSGGGPYIQGVVSGEVHLGLTLEGTVTQYKEKLIPLTIVGNKRRPTLPNTPSLAELGHPKVVGGITFSFNLPAGTPKAVVDRLNAATNQALQTTEVKELMAKLNYDIVGGTVEFSAKRLADAGVAYAGAAKAAGIRPD